MTMHLAAFAPWALSLLVPLSEAIVTRSVPKEFSLLSIGQVPGPTPQYIAYGPPEFTTFGNSTSACQACIEFFPEKQDGKRFNSALYQDSTGGSWQRACRAGICDFRDPQTDPVGGVEGKGVGPGGKPDGRTCITRDPVPWYDDCEPIAMAAAKTLTEVTRYCSYKEQMFIPPPAGNVSYLAGSKGKAWSRIGGNHEQCLATITKQGANLMDTMSFCDSDLPALSGCCETVFKSLNCVAETATANGLWSASKGSIFASMDKEGAQMLEAFAEFCVPLCQNTKEEFCKKFSGADICVSYEECADCTGAGGLWCPKLEECHCPSPDPPCIKPPVTTPLQCLPKDDKKSLLRGVKSEEDSKAKINRQVDAEEEALEESEKALCKHAEFANKWLKKD